METLLEAQRYARESVEVLLLAWPPVGSISLAREMLEIRIAMAWIDGRLASIKERLADTVEA